MNSKLLTRPHFSTKTLLNLFSRIKVNNTTDCWEWTGSIQSRGYGVFAPKQGTQYLAHRLLYVMENGAIPTGMKDGVIDHLCKNTICCNPKHLRLVSQRENVMSGDFALWIEKMAKRTHCKRGHLLTPPTFDGKQRWCRTCHKASVKKYKARIRNSR